MWHYIPVRYKAKDGTWVYTVQESFGKIGHTIAERGIAPIDESKKGLIQCLEWMLKDLKRYPTKTVKLKDMSREK